MTEPQRLQPQQHDAVLGGQSESLRQAAVLGGLETLPQRFPRMSVAEQQASLLTLIECGDAGLAQIVHCLRSSHIGLRQMAYELLQMLPDEAAKMATIQGFPLLSGDRVYQIYAAQFVYNDDRYDIVLDFQVAEMSEIALPLVGQYIDQTTVQQRLNQVHRYLAVQDFQRSFPYFLETEAPDTNDEDEPWVGCAYLQFPWQAWCQTHAIPLRWPHETPAQYESKFWRLFPKGALNQELADYFLQEWQRDPIVYDGLLELRSDLARRTIAFLRAARWNDLIAELWQAAIGPLAFIHDQTVSQTMYCDVQADGSIIVR